MEQREYSEVSEMANITKEDLLRTADLARLIVSDDEAQMYSSQLSEILSFTEKMNELNTDHVKPTTNGNDTTNVLREDKPVQWDKTEEALHRAPEHEDGQFKVPSIID
ncbi:MAG TPA: Asp-tRNA(Asn)/Glu-tRNA(Gln) amidotransferase subunit GatC [Massilibacterium sp.]|nr:Asp-tRNA(Asn)/Glu-tRNA(Gln) amidotransferase subunit GatC [Massilibacterium sp.]